MSTPRLPWAAPKVSLAYSISPARYAKGKVVVHTPSEDGFKTRAGSLAQYFSNGRWSNRCRGSVMSPTAAAKFEQKFLEGWDASCLFERRLIEPSRAA